MPHWRDIADSFLDFIFPPTERALRVAAERDEPLPLALDERRIGWRAVTVFSSYDNPRVRDAVCALKFDRDRKALALLARLLDDYLLESAADEVLFGGSIICVPVPLGAKRFAERGMNQVEAIISATDAVRSGRVRCVNALVRTRETAMQSALPRHERLANVRDAFRCAHSCPPLRNICVLLIDDVTTTGATLAEAAKPLAAMGAKVELLALAG